MESKTRELYKLKLKVIEQIIDNSSIGQTYFL